MPRYHALVIAAAYVGARFTGVFAGASRDQPGGRRLADTAPTADEADPAHDDHSADGSHDAAHTDDHATDDHGDHHDDHATDGAEHHDDGGHHSFVATYGSCHHACHDCELPKCADFWLREKSAGKQGPRDTGRMELVFSEGLVVLAILCVTLLFEALHHQIKRWTARQKTPSGWMAHITGVVEPHPHEKHEAEHPSDFVTCFVWNEWYPHFSRRLLDQFTWEIMVLGFLALIVFACHKLGAFDAIAGGRDLRWGPQTHGQVFATVEVAHFSLFTALCAYFLSLFIVFSIAEHVMGRGYLYERILAKERASAREASHEAPKPCHSARLAPSAALLQSIVDLEKKPPKAAKVDDYRCLRHGVVSFLKKAGLAHHRPAMRIDDGPGSFTDDFHFAVYLRAHFEALVLDLIDIKTTTWLLFMVLLSIFIILARSRVLGSWTTFAPGLFIMFVLITSFVVVRVKVKSFVARSRKHLADDSKAAHPTDLAALPTHARDEKGKKVRSAFTAEIENLLVHAIQACLLLAMYFIGSVVCSDASYKHPGNGHHLRQWDWFVAGLTMFFVLALGPACLVYANILLRIPPFIDDDDYDVIQQIVIMSTLKSFDVDGNGILDAEEIQEIMHQLDDSLSDEEIAAMIKEADVDGDGKIDYKEFYTIMLRKDVDPDLPTAGDHSEWATHGKEIHAIPVDAKHAPRAEAASDVEAKTAEA